MSEKQMWYDVSYMQELMRAAFWDAYEAYEALHNNHGDQRFSIAMNYLVLSHQSYVELNRMKHEKDLSHYEIDGFLTAYDEYKFELKKVITAKDENTSWLYSKKEMLLESWKSTNEFLSNYIKSATKK
ncbi:hypothetical protein CBW65_23670 [Tumebacillus avium]|uniref:HEPN domain-containing protein n=1 Tax=Tumebacillus avium TaxID=1903704 RepID=A0A1Y0IWG9_9BACL|nr:hypothetical protein [Tumebacillus avium]ARU63684.1 hypothetical protein CBW65_23670 [Tumebacillus avium]